MSDDSARDGGQERHAVLEVFGMKLEVTNPRLAELLTMDAAEVLTADVRDLVPQASEEGDISEVADDLTALGVPQATPQSEEEARIRREFRGSVDAMGAALGFSTAGDGVWSSPTGISIMTRTVERPLSLAAAAHFVGEVSVLTGLREPDTALLFIVESAQTANVFKVAIRQRRLYDVMRTISLADLEEIRRLLGCGKLTHQQVLMILAPVANIDAGEVLAVLRADGCDEPADGTT